LLGARLRRPLRRIRGALPAALEPGRPGRRGAERVPRRVGDRDDRVVERGLDVRDAAADISPLLALFAFGHSSGRWSVVSGQPAAISVRDNPLTTDHGPLLLPEVLHALLAGHRLPRALPGAGVRLAALAADRQVPAVPGPAVAADVLEPLDV